MWNKPGKEQLAKIPRLYETEKINGNDKIIYLHFFIGGCDWYMAEFDGEDLFFGFANLNDPQNAEWGYISFKELDEVNLDGLEVDNDLHRFRPELPTLIMTGFGESLPEETLKHYGVHEVIGKPIMIRKLADSIRKVLDK